MSQHEQGPARTPVYRVADVPAFADEAALAAFWDTHSVTSEYLEDARRHGWQPPAERPAERLARRRAEREHHAAG